jgi:hypothetical protein
MLLHFSRLGEQHFSSFTHSTVDHWLIVAAIEHPNPIPYTLMNRVSLYSSLAARKSTANSVSYCSNLSTVSANTGSSLPSFRITACPASNMYDSAHTVRALSIFAGEIASVTLSFGGLAGMVCLLWCRGIVEVCLYESFGSDSGPNSRRHCLMLGSTVPYVGGDGGSALGDVREVVGRDKENEKDDQKKMPKADDIK